jgi:quercetin dioxygenase-like cupin family protein
MAPGAQTPEELESLFEDAFVTRDREALARLFEDGAVLVAGDGGHEARGGQQVARLAAAMWAVDRTYVADPRRVIQARDTALVVAERGINVVRRGSDGCWRFAISLLPFGDTDTKDEGGAMTDETSPMPVLKPVAVPSDGGEARWWFGGLAVFKATAADTGGQMSIIEITEPPGAEAPLHVHHREDEAFWVLEGEVTFVVGDMTVEAKAGDFAFGPRDIPHRYKVGDTGCRMLFICTPGGFEDLITGMSEPAGSRTLPPPPEEEPDWERIAAVAKAHGADLLG